jgi:hypothetical protein
MSLTIELSGGRITKMQQLEALNIADHKSYKKRNSSPSA